MMKGLLTVIQVTRPEPIETNPKTAEIMQWIEQDQIARGAILSALSNTISDVYYFRLLHYKVFAINGRAISMGNSSTTEVLRIGNVDLKFLLGCVLSLKRVHHLPTVRRNIISGSEIKPQILLSVGCLAKVLVPKHKRKKLDPKTLDAMFLGYVETSYALRFLVIKSEISGIKVNTIVEFNDVVFLEDVFPMKIGIHLSVSLASTPVLENVEKMPNVGLVLVALV
ncbi:hypothetical protein Sango_2039900 [Sesamum angolense]|uniref:Uncharacterized protein n=1 Tax=Sesamum angolense TaxID=2727404 RepID=A0AAE1WFX9_9LAMI|nr:hypothetical protein Sango_2039900 [Sesamum angolense]